MTSPASLPPADSPSLLDYEGPRSLPDRRGRGSLAVAATLFCCGLGHLLAGDRRRAFRWFLIGLTMTVVALVPVVFPALVPNDAVPTQTPFTGAPFAIKTTGTTTIQAEDFDNGGEAIAYHDSDSSNNGGAYRTTGVDIQAVSGDSGLYNLAWTRAGEWLKYSINVASSGSYNVGFRVSSPLAGGNFHVDVDGANASGAFSVPATGSWQTWTTITKKLSLSAGQHILRLAFDSVGGGGGVGNFNYLTISPAVSAPAPLTLTSTTAAYVQAGASAGLNFGSSAQLMVKNYKTADVNRETYIKFDLSSVSSLTSAKLRLWGYLSSTTNPTVQTSVFASSNTSWSENTITWNNRPAASLGLFTTTLSGTTPTWYQWDITTFLKSEKAAGRNIVTFVLINPAQSVAASLFNSDDATTNRPQLLIT